MSLKLEVDEIRLLPHRKYDVTVHVNRYREAMPPGIPKSTKERLGEFPVRVALKERSSRRVHQPIETIEEEAKRQVVRLCEEIVRSRTA